MNDTHARPIVPEDLMAIKSVADVQLSLDGRHVAYVLTEISLEEDSYRSTIWIAPATGGPPVQLTRGPGRDSAPRWSPDGLSLAFLSDRGGGHPQMFLLPMSGGEPRRLTAAGHGAGPASWSPDGTKVVFAATAPKEHAPAGKAESHWAHRPRVVSKAQYKADGAGYTFDACSQLFALALESGTLAQLTSGDQESRAPAWSPDGTRIAFSRARGGVADFSLFDIWTADADGGSPSRLTESIGRATSPTWSPDGAMIACYGTDAQEPGYGDPMTRVWLVPASGGAARTLTAEYDRSVVLLPPPAVTPGPVWSADGDSVTFVAADAGNAHVVRAEVSTAAVRTVVGGERQVLSASAGEGAGRIAFAASDPHLPSDVFTCRWDGADERRLTRINEPELSQWALPRVGRRAFSVPDHGTVEGWLFQPSAGAGAAPLLVDIHGGPASFHGNVFSAGYFYRYVLASRGRWGERDLPERDDGGRRAGGRRDCGWRTAGRRRVLLRWFHDVVDDRTYRSVQSGGGRCSRRQPGIVPRHGGHRHVVCPVGDAGRPGDTSRGVPPAFAHQLCGAGDDPDVDPARRGRRPLSHRSGRGVVHRPPRLREGAGGICPLSRWQPFVPQHRPPQPPAGRHRARCRLAGEARYR